MELGESFKVKVTLKKLVKRLNYTLVEGTGFVASEIPLLHEQREC
jgi:hypothetical protein